ncbi:MAG: anthranilate phosphoribosyltransferase [Candidatus Acidiferrum sp.]
MLMAHPSLERIQSGEVLGRAEAEGLMEELLSGRLDTPQIVGLLKALNARPIEIVELAGFARVMRRHAARVFRENEAQPSRMVDTCGTGGDGSGSFNISTAAAIVAAAAGARVAKHGNRAATSRSGSADVLEALGVGVEVPLERMGRAINEVGIGFLFARTAHAAMRHAKAARQEMGVRTVFNLLGPLTNPAGAQCQVVGVFSAEVIAVVAGSLAELNTEHAFVVHGAGGLDDISISGETLVAEVKNGAVRRFTITPEAFGVERAPVEALKGGTATENAEIIRSILRGERGARRDVVVVNAAAALVAAGLSQSFVEGAQRSATAIDSGAARRILERLIIFTKD